MSSYYYHGYSVVDYRLDHEVQSVEDVEAVEVLQNLVLLVCYGLVVVVFIHVMYTYIYIYIERERYMCMYMYIYIYMYTLQNLSCVNLQRRAKGFIQNVVELS